MKSCSGGNDDALDTLLDDTGRARYDGRWFRFDDEEKDILMRVEAQRLEDEHRTRTRGNPFPWQGLRETDPRPATS